MNGKIYIITNLLSGKRYIGQTLAKSAQARWRSHRHCAERGKYLSSYLYKAMRKYGVENFQFKVIIDEIRTQRELDRLERVWIEACRTMEMEHGYNLKPGGFGGNLAERTKRKIAERLKGNRNSAGVIRTEEQRKAASERLRGQKRSPEFAKACRERQLGQKRSKESSRKKSEFMKANPNSGQIQKGAKLSEETRRRMSISRMGRIPWNKGLRNGIREVCHS